MVRPNQKWSGIKKTPEDNLSFTVIAIRMDKTGRGAGVGVGDQWIKPGDRELGDHDLSRARELCDAF